MSSEEAVSRALGALLASTGARLRSAHSQISSASPSSSLWV